MNVELAPPSPTDQNLPAVIRDQRIDDDLATVRAIEQGIRQYWKIVLKYRRTVVSVAAIIFTIAALYAFTATPHYIGTALIRIESFDPLLGSGKAEDVLQQKSSRQDYLETQIQQIRSLSVADLVLKDAEIRAVIEEQSQGFLSFLFSSGKRKYDQADQSAGYGAPSVLLKKYLTLVNVVPVRRTMLVQINVTHPSKQFAARVANRHAEAYIEWSRISRIEGQSKGVEFLSAQAAELQQRVEMLEREQAEYAELHSIVALNKEENIVVQKMARLNELLAEATAREVEATNRYLQAKADAASDASAYDDSSVQTARSELAQLQVERAELQEKFNPTYPKLQQTEARIATLKKSIREQRNGIIKGLESKSLAAQNENKALQEELESQKGLAFDLSRRQVKFNSITRDLESTRDLLIAVTKQMKEVELAAQSKGSNIVLVDRAIVPKLPAYPRKMVTILLGAMVGLGVGVLTAFALHAMDNTVRTPEDIAGILQLASLGHIPIFLETELALTGQEDARRQLPSTAPANRVEGESGVDEGVTRVSALSRLKSMRATPAVMISARAQVAEAYRLIRTNIFLSRAGGMPRVLLITSALPGEGKTTVSSNLAASLASTGAKVVLLDSDLRKPSVHKRFGISRQAKGVSDVLTGQVTLEEVTVESEISGVSVIPCGTLPPNPAELIGSPEMSSLLTYLKSLYDFVIIDSAPVIPVTDTVLLGYQADGVVFVVSSGKTPLRAAHEAKTRLERGGARVLGAVLNRVDIKGRDYYDYSYSGYSGYYQAAGDESEEQEVQAA